MIHNITDRERYLSKLLQNATQRINDLEVEVFEQARLLGMSGEREIALRAKIARQEKTLKLALEAICGSGDFLFNWHDCEPNNEREIRRYQATLADNEKAFKAIREVLGETK